MKIEKELGSRSSSSRSSISKKGSVKEINEEEAEESVTEKSASQKSRRSMMALSDIQSDFKQKIFYSFKPSTRYRSTRAYGLEFYNLALRLRHEES